MRLVHTRCLFLLLHEIFTVGLPPNNQWQAGLIELTDWFSFKHCLEIQSGLVDLSPTLWISRTLCVCVLGILSLCLPLCVFLLSRPNSSPLTGGCGAHPRGQLRSQRRSPRKALNCSINLLRSVCRSNLDPWNSPVSKKQCAHFTRSWSAGVTTAPSRR